MPFVKTRTVRVDAALIVFRPCMRRAASEVVAFACASAGTVQCLQGRPACEISKISSHILTKITGLIFQVVGNPNVINAKVC